MYGTDESAGCMSIELRVSHAGGTVGHSLIAEYHAALQEIRYIAAP
jgi:hypothetical protein